MFSLRSVSLVLLLGLAGSVSYSQKVTVTATTKQKEISKVLSKGREESDGNRAFFSAIDHCRSFLDAEDWYGAETTCRLALSQSEKLPKTQPLERSDAQTCVGWSLLGQKRAGEAITFFMAAIASRESYSKEPDADTADIYTMLGHARSSSGEIESALTNFSIAEKMYLAAFSNIGDDGDEIRFSYPRRLRKALGLHYELLKAAGRSNDADALQLRIVQVEKDFAKYLAN